MTFGLDVGDEAGGVGLCRATGHQFLDAFGGYGVGGCHEGGLVVYPRAVGGGVNRMGMSGLRGRVAARSGRHICSRVTASSALRMASLMMRAAGVEYRMYDLYLGWIGIVLWIWVSVIWRDRALIMLNTVSFFMLTVAIMKEWAGV